MVGSPNAIIRETRQCWRVRRADRPRAWLAGVRASVVALKRVMTVERRDAGRWQCGDPKDGEKKPTRVPARASQWGSPPSAIGLGDTERQTAALGDEAKSRSLSTEHPPTGEPEAGDPPVRFGGRGKVQSLVPTPISNPHTAQRPG